MEKKNFYTLTDELMDKKGKYVVIVFTKDSFKKDYSLESRSYVTCTDWGKWFISGMCGNSLYGDCLDGTDKAVRLDWYLGDWKIDYSYEITEKEYEDLRLGVSQ